MRQVLSVIGIGVVIFVCSSGLAAGQLRTIEVVGGLDHVLDLVQDPADPSVQFVVQQTGLVLVLRNGTLEPVPFIDLRDQVSLGGERGLLGLAFDPNVSRRRFWVNFTNLPGGHTVVSRFERSLANPLIANVASRRDFRWPDGRFEILQPRDNHNGGHMVFGPDGYLYIGMGDGGPGYDQYNNGQRPDTLLGKMLRLDVNVADAHPNGYIVPADNPFVDGLPIQALTEIWDFGLRNPWRFSFDDGPGGTGALIIGDVGQKHREELNYSPAGQGGRNYGWRNREGRIETPTITHLPPAYTPLTEPLLDYPHTQGQSVTAGYVYRGTALDPSYQGRYFFADFVRGRVWSLGLTVDPVTGEAAVANQLEHTAELGGLALGYLAGFGRDAAGELYLVKYSRPEWMNPGGIIKILPPAPSTTPRIGGVPSVTTRWDRPTGEIAFEVGGANLAALTISATSSNQMVVADAGGFAFSGSGAVRVLTVTPAGTAGTATVTLIASDGAMSASTTFTVTVTNDTPTISNVFSVTTPVNTPTGALAVTIGDRETAAAALTVSATSTNDNVVATATGFSWGGAGMNRSLTITPVPGARGTTTITLQVSDGVRSATDVFVMTVDFDPASPDLVWQHPGGSVSAWRMTGPDFSGDAETVSGRATEWRVVASADFTGDGTPDLLWQHPNGPVAVWTMNRRMFSGDSQTVHGRPTEWRVVGAADLNGDRKPDLLWQHPTGPVAVWLMDGTTPTGMTHSLFGQQTEWRLISAGDFSGDGKADLLWQHPQGPVAIWKMNGTSFTGDAQTTSGRVTEWRVRGAGDFNGDGHLDLTWQHPTGAVSVWFMNRMMANGNAETVFSSATEWTLVGRQP